LADPRLLASVDLLSLADQRDERTSVIGAISDTD